MRVQTTPIIEPLSKATGELLKPADLAPNDYLEVDIDKDLTHFVVQARAYRPYKGTFLWNETEEDVVEVNGQKYLQDRHGASNNAAANWLQRVPERKELGHGRWRLAGTDYTAIVLHHAWPEDKIIWKDEAAHLLYRTLLLRFTSMTEGAVRAALYKVQRVVPDLPTDFICRPEFPPKEHQRVPILNSLHQIAYALFMEPGTCKTSTSIYRVMLESMRKRAGLIPGVPKTIYRVLIVCPNAVRLNWQLEFAQFASVPGKVTRIAGDLFTRARRLMDGTSDEADCAWAACIIGIDSVEPTLAELMATPWDLMIIDEAHWVKNRRTSRFQACHRLVKEGHVRQRMILTGTPIANTLMDLWAQLEFLGEGMSGFLSYDAFRKFHGKFTRLQDGSAIEKLVGLKNIPLIQERLARLSFMIRKDECGLDLPDKQYDTREVEMTKVQAEFYQQIKEQLALELAEYDIDGVEAGAAPGLGRKRLTAHHVLTKLLRLAQVTCGFVVWDQDIDPEGNVLMERHAEAIPGPNPKIDLVMELLTAEERDPKGKTIIWCCYRHDVKAIMARLQQEGRKAVCYMGEPEMSSRQRDEAAYAYNTDPTVREMVAMVQSGGTGLNLLGYVPEQPDLVDTYTDHMIHFSQNWKPTDRSQAEDRGHRVGTRCVVRNTDLVVPGTIDEEIRARVFEKRQTAMNIQNLRDILSAVLDFHGALV